MRRLSLPWLLALGRTVGTLVIAALSWLPRGASAQTWNDVKTRSLVESATNRRAVQLADTALVDYRADAHGYVTFLAQVGEGFTEPPRVVKADELALTVYWRAPNLSKQIIQGRRDTLLLPTDIQYHRDHLGIVQNNFPNIIRLGEGDEVRDVPHPLSQAGLNEYDFAISDSLRIALPGKSVYVYEVKVRPKDDRQPRVVGALYIDPSGGQVVRMAFNFTHAAFLDKQLEDLSIVLENGLVGTRFWLPRRQEIEIRRSGTWMDYPIRGIIRGRWEISNYQVNAGIGYNVFAGQEIVQAPREQQRRYQWSGKILDSLPPDVRAVTDADVQRVQNEARALVRAKALQRAQTVSLSARGLSELVRFDRAQGLSLGAGVTQRYGAGVDVTLRGRYGIDDEIGVTSGSIGWLVTPNFSFRLTGGRWMREIGEEPERSQVVNSVAAQEFASDYTDPVLTAGGFFSVDVGRHLGFVWRGEAGYEHPRQLSVDGVPVKGTFEPLILVDQDQHAIRGTIRAEHPTSLSLFGSELRVVSRADYAAYRTDGCGNSAVSPCNSSDVAILSLVLNAERPIGNQRIVWHTAFGAAIPVKGTLPSQELVYFGGPVTGPGYDFHSLVGRTAVSQRLEWRVPVPFLPVSLGRFGHTPGSAKLAPYATIVALTRADAGPVRVGEPAPSLTSGGYASVGVGLLTFFDLLRIDVARGLRQGSGRWIFAIDVTHDMWGVL